MDIAVLAVVFVVLDRFHFDLVGYSLSFLAQQWYETDVSAYHKLQMQE
jgi:hypothetical protein